MSLQHLCRTHNPYWVCCSHHRAKSIHHLLIPCVLEEAVLVPYHQKQSSPIATFRRRMSLNTNATSQGAAPVIEPSDQSHAALAADAHGSTPSSKSPEGKAASGSRSSTSPTRNDSENAKWEKIIAHSRAKWRSLIRNHRKGRRRTLFGIKNAANSGINTQRGNDPFDYEQKYPDDEAEFTEMGPMARIWKVFLDECGSFDVEMIDDWRDALDVLLVFAGLFSAVVTTFVAQTCQDLKPDFTEINVHLMYESLAMERAKANGTSVLEVPPSKLNPFTPFQATRSDTWVNGLWFTSLALSLTTALLAVLTKQWIHQYLSVPSGTPRDRCRVRQFRFMNLQTWHVPVIIGLLPVLMHLSLGVFFAGLVVFLFSLNSAISAVIGTIAVLAFAAYFTTNLIPLFRIDCPYKTPLTLYTHDLFTYILPLLKRFMGWLHHPLPWKFARHVATTPKKHVATSPRVLNLKAMERVRVQSIAGTLDAHSLSWLYTISSNSSVQRLVLQALGNMPVEDVHVFQREIPSVAEDILKALHEHRTPERRYGHQRLLRANIRFSDDPSPNHGLGPEQPVENTLFDLLDPSQTEVATTFLSEQIIRRSVEFDAITWAHILENALLDGLDFLEIGVAGSKVWPTFLSWFITQHYCNDRRHIRNPLTKTSFAPRGLGRGYKCKFAIYSTEKVWAPPKSTNDGMDIERAVRDFLYPSLGSFLLSVVSSQANDTDSDLPCDIRVHLGLLNVKIVQSCTTQVDSYMTPYQILVDNVCVYMAIQHSEICLYPLTRHPGIVRAVFSSVHSAVTSDTFATLVSVRCQLDLFHALFRALVLDVRLRTEHRQSVEDLAPKVIHAMFGNPLVFPHPLVAEILEYVYLSGSGIGIEIYRCLVERCFIDEVERRFSHMPMLDPSEEEEMSENRDDGYAYPWFASTVVDGLDALEHTSPDIHARFMAYLCQPHTVFVLFKILILADVDACNRLWKLARIVDREIWTSTCSKIIEFLLTENASRIHDTYFHLPGNLARHPCKAQVKIVIRSFADLPGLVSELSKAARWSQDAFPLVVPLYSSPRQIEAFIAQELVD